MIDPVTASLLLKLIDVAFVGISAIQRAREADNDLEPGLAELRALKARVERGDISPEDADSHVDVVIGLLMRPLDEAIDRL